MALTDNIELNGLHAALQQARTKLTRQTETVKATIALIKLLEQTIKDAQKGK